MKKKVIVIQDYYNTDQLNEIDFYRVFSYDGEEITYYWDDPIPNESLAVLIERLSTEDNIVKSTNSRVIANLLTQSDYWHHNNDEEDIINFKLAWNLIS